MLFDPASHERLSDRPWSESHVRAAIAAIVIDAESAFDEDKLWPAHPRDEDFGPLPALTSLYLGASGVIWALDELERLGAAGLRRTWAPLAVRIDWLSFTYLVLPVGFANLSARLSGASGTLGSALLADSRRRAACFGRSCISSSGTCSRWCGCWRGHAVRRSWRFSSSATS